MAFIDDLKTASSELSASADKLIAFAEDLKIKLADSIPASELQPILDEMKVIKTKIDTARQ